MCNPSVCHTGEERGKSAAKTRRPRGPWDPGVREPGIIRGWSGLLVVVRGRGAAADDRQLETLAVDACEQRARFLVVGDRLGLAVERQRPPDAVGDVREVRQ